MDRKTTKCTDCRLSQSCGKQNAIAGWGNPNAPLVIVLDDPGSTWREKMLIWLIRKLGLGENDVFIDYTFKCQLPAKVSAKQLLESYKICWTSHPRTSILNAKALVLAGPDSAKYIAKCKMSEMHGKKDPETETWIIYDFNFAVMNPAECVDAWRVMYKAAEEAGLSPKLVMDVEPFRFPSKKLT